MLPEPPPTPEGLSHVGRYVRHMRVSLDRMFENALDWEHLPWLHDSSFAEIERRKVEGEPGDTWTARACFPGNPEPVGLELALDRDARAWVTSTLSGPGAGSRIHTVAVPDDDPSTGLHVVVDFFVPGLGAATDAQREAVGQAYIALYTRLYDEDESMMVERQRALDALAAAKEAPDSPREIELGSEHELRERLPADVELGGRPWRIEDGGAGTFTVRPLQCPHWLGPLERTERADELRCPWHGYRFDVGSGRELDGRRCRLPSAPEIVRAANGQLRLALT